MSTKPPRSNYATKLAEFPSIVRSENSPRWREHFSDRIGTNFDGRLVLEIGCADAAFLCKIAAKFPATAFIGIDWKFKAVYDAATRVAANDLRNVALIRGRAQDISKTSGKNEIDEVWIFHPEPCDREAELKNRLICEPFLIDVHVSLRRAGSCVCIKTDHAGYYASMLEVSEKPAIQERFDVTIRSTDFWGDEAVQLHVNERAFAGEATAFEHRFMRKKSPIYYLELAKR